MTMHNCDKWAILATLDSQMAILPYAQEEYSRLTCDLEKSSSNGAAMALAAIDQDYERLEALKDQVHQLIEKIESAGEKKCEVNWDFECNTTQQGL